MAGGLLASVWMFRASLSVGVASGCRVAPPCPVMLIWTGMKVMPPLSLAIPAEVRG